MNKLGESKRDFSTKSCVIFVILTVLTLNSVFLTLMISKSVVINQENQIFLERILALNTKSDNFNNLGISNNGDIGYVFPNEMPPPPPEQLVQQSLNSSDACPPCPKTTCPTTPKPDPIDGHLNPVGILNDIMPLKTNYECLHRCVHPVTHTADLTIDDDCCVGITWTGVGKSKAASKHAAAYKALQEKFPDEAASVGDQYIPPVYNPGPCEKPLAEKIFESRGKC